MVLLPVTLGEPQGPEPLTRRERWTNSVDCPPSWKSRPPEMPSMPCPPGYSRYPYPHPSFHRPSYPACPPWVDSEGKCHMSNRVYDGDSCRSWYGEETYAEFQENARLRAPLGPPGTPAPPCRRLEGSDAGGFH